MGKISVGIYGGAGYTAGELIRILINHPSVRITTVQSGSQSGKSISSIHTDLIGDSDLVFEPEIDFQKIDVLFLCKGHGESKKYLEGVQVPDHVKLIDLSHDYRAIDNGMGFTYGLPELYRQQIASARKIANPGCFATCIQLGLLPAMDAKLIDGPIHTTGITGSTGAGQAKTNTSHFSWRNNNMSVYKPFVHQHLDEISDHLGHIHDVRPKINFIPYRGNFTRGIIVSSYFKTDASEEEIRTVYSSYYEKATFTHYTDQNPDLKMVVNTNKALVHTQKHDDQALVISIIDNLLKGASGQAVQNMNIMFGLEETSGLTLKASNF